MRAAALAGGLLLAAGCGEDLVCPPEARLQIVDPLTTILEDAAPGTPGVQTEVRVTSTLARLPMTLFVEDAGEVLAELTVTSDALGNAVFGGVTVPAAGADLRVIAEPGNCGFAEDTRRVVVTAGGDCALAFAEPPVDNAFYAPLGVFDAALDGAPLVPGYQGDVIVRANRGLAVRLFQDGGAGEEAVGTAISSALGEARFGVSLPDGGNRLRATCSGPEGAGLLDSAVLAVHVDTAAPGCAIAAPAPGTEITPALDTDPATAGIQLTLTGRVTGDDVTGEPAAFDLTGPTGITTPLAGGPLDATGEFPTPATFTPGTSPATYGLTFTARDHAGNPCTAHHTYTVSNGP